jgi:hypothetical protein
MARWLPLLVIATTCLTVAPRSAIAEVLVIDFDSTAPRSPLRVTNDDGVAGAHARFDDNERRPTFDLPTPIDGAFTVAAYVRARAWPEGDNERGFGRDAPATVVGLLDKDRNQVAVLRVRRGQIELNITFGPDQFASVTAGDTLALNEWIHVAARHDGSTMTLFVNGRPVQSRSAPGISGVATIAALGAIGNRRHVGDLDEIVVAPFAFQDEHIAGLYEARAAAGAVPDASEAAAAPTAAAAPQAPDEEDGPLASQVLRVHPDSVFPVLDSNADIIAVPGPEGRTDLWVMSREPYRLRPVGIDTPDEWFDQSNYPFDVSFENIPLYGQPEQLAAQLPSGFYNVIHREDGLFDLVHGRSLTYHRHVGTLEEPAFESHRIAIGGDPRELEALRVFRHGEKFVGDVNGNGVPDLMFMHLDDRRHRNPWISRPGGVRPWEMERDRRVGPSEDPENIGRFRGNDIEDVPTAKTNTLELMWAPGTRDAAGRLSFAEPRPVFLGRTDYPVVWERFQNRAMPRMLETPRGRFIMLIEPMGRAVALPLLHADEEVVQVGRAEPLLADGPMFSALVMSGGTGGIVDINGDGRLEILIRGGAWGGLTVLAGDGPGDYREVAVLRRTGEGGRVAGIELSMTERVDLDGNGIEDIIIGTAAGSLFIYEGTEDPLVYRGPYFATMPGGFVFFNRAREHTNLQGPQEISWGYMNVHAADFDGDGHVDLFINDNTSYPQLLRGTGERYAFAQPETITYRGHPLPVQWRTKLVVIPAEDNFAGTGLACIAFIDLDRGLSVAVPASPGSSEIARIVPLLTEAGEGLVLCGFNGQSGRTKVKFADWTGNGVKDLVFGTAGGLLPFFDPELPYDPQEFRQQFGFRQQAQPYVWENLGSDRDPVFDAAGPRRIGIDREGVLSPDLFRFGYHVFSIDPTDLTGDGSLDFIAADENGLVRYFLEGDFATASPREASPADPRR